MARAAGEKQTGCSGHRARSPQAFRRQGSFTKRIPPVEKFITALEEEEGAEASLPEVFQLRWTKGIAALRSASSTLSQWVGHHPTIEELRENEEGRQALDAIDELRAQRKQLLGGGEASGSGDGIGLAGEADLGLFRGYSRELLRLRQLLAKANQQGETSAGAGRAKLMLEALAQRASTDASFLPPPPLLPGILHLSEEYPTHCKYIWQCERAPRMEALSQAIHDGAHADEHITYADVNAGLREKRKRMDAALSLVHAEEKHERLAEKGRWAQLLEEWKNGSGGGVPRETVKKLAARSSSPVSQMAAGRRSPPKLGAMPNRAGDDDELINSFKERKDSMRKDSARNGGLSARLGSFVGGRDMPWVDELAKEYGLEYDARERAAGVAREMASAGYTGNQARTVVLGMLHGTKERLMAAWKVFVPIGEEGMLTSAEWQVVLAMLTGGLGMSQSETDQLFQLFDEDGSGTLDFGEFCEVLDALPMQRTLEESPLGSAVSAMQSIFVLRPQLLNRLTFGQLSAAGRIVQRLRAAGFSDVAASRVVDAIFLSRSRSALKEAWDVLRIAAEAMVEKQGGKSRKRQLAEQEARKAKEKAGVSFKDDVSKAARDQRGRRQPSPSRRGSLFKKPEPPPPPKPVYVAPTIDNDGFKYLLPLLGEDLPLSRVERLFEEVDEDNSGSLDFDEFVVMVRRLKPKGVTRNFRAAGQNAFDSLSMAKTVKHRQLRKAVPVKRRSEAGTLLLVLRDFGYDDDQLFSILQAIYPPVPPSPEATDTSPSKKNKKGKAVEMKSEAVQKAELETWASETAGSVMKAAWTAFGWW